MRLEKSILQYNGGRVPGKYLTSRAHDGADPSLLYLANRIVALGKFRYRQEVAVNSCFEELTRSTFERSILRERWEPQKAHRVRVLGVGKKQKKL